MTTRMPACLQAWNGPTGLVTWRIDHSHSPERQAPGELQRIELSSSRVRPAATAITRKASPPWSYWPREQSPARCVKVRSPWKSVGGQQGDQSFRQTLEVDSAMAVFECSVAINCLSLSKGFGQTGLDFFKLSLAYSRFGRHGTKPLRLDRRGCSSRLIPFRMRRCRGRDAQKAYQVSIAAWINRLPSCRNSPTGRNRFR